MLETEHWRLTVALEPNCLGLKPSPSLYFNLYYANCRSAVETLLCLSFPFRNLDNVSVRVILEKQSQ